jgi:hypothetical protein
MTAAIFGLLGVIVGGVIQTLGSWASERRHDSRAVTKAARLMMPQVTGMGNLLHDIDSDDPPTWATVTQAVGTYGRQWDEHHDVFAGSLDFIAYAKLYGAAASFSKLTRHAPADVTQPVETKDVLQLADAQEHEQEAFIELTMLAMGGLGRLRFRRWLQRQRRRLMTNKRKEAQLQRMLDES